MAMVKSFGALLKPDWKGEEAVCKPKRLDMFAPGLCAMLIAAVAVSVGVAPPFFALLSSVVHGVDVGPLELTQAARMFARVLISLFGTVPLPAGVVARATPVPSVSRLATVKLALLTSFPASAVFEDEMCVASAA